MGARELIVLAVLALGSLATPASASGPIRHDADYPMSAAAFRQHLVEKAARYRERLDEKLTEHAVSEAKRAEARKRLAAVVLEIDRAADKPCADGTVSLAEGKQIRALSKQLRDALYRDLGLSRSKGE
jgi:hypothetical protein